MKEKLKDLFTSESVSEGHPDKLCDQISDAIVDACLAKDSEARVACECAVTTNYLLIFGEITCKEKVDYEEVAKGVIKRIGYHNDELGVNYQNVVIENRIHTQSPDIALGVNHKKMIDLGAGDQGIMFGYATDESEGYMPLGVSIAHKLVRVASSLRKMGQFKYSRPDMKSQVTIDYTDPKHPKIATVLMSCQHTPDVDEKEFKDFIYHQIMIPVIKSFSLNTDFKYLINPTGRFEIGGPKGDSGLTGRKISVDTYGGTSRHGGGCFSGKDPTKVDRSAAYMARYIAKNLVAAGVASRLEIQLGYAIGISQPLSINISTFHTSNYSDEKILEVIDKLFDCRPGAIISLFHLNKPNL